MVKRAAEKELTDRNWQDREDGEVLEEGPMKVAAPQVIERRQIKRLPKAKAAASSPSISPAPSASAFGSSATRNPFATLNPPTSSSPFSFDSTAPANKASSLFGNTPPTTTSLFGSSSTPSTSLFGAKNVHNSTTESSSTGTNPSSLFNNSNTSIFGSKLDNQISTPSVKPSTQALTTYYAALRGLNLSAVSALERVNNADAFENLDQVLERLRIAYNKQRETIVKDFEAQGGSPADSNSTKNTKTSNEASNKNTQSSVFSVSNLFTNQPPPPKDSDIDPTREEVPKVGQSSQSLSTNSSGVKKVEVSTSTGAAASHKASSRPGAFSTAAPARPSPLRYETEQDVSDPQSSVNKEVPTEPKQTFTPSFATTSAAPSSSLFSFKPQGDVGSVTTTKSDPTLPTTTSFSASSAFSTSNSSLSAFGGQSTLSNPSTSHTSLFGSAPTNPLAATPAKPSFEFGRGMSGSPGSNPVGFSGFGSAKLSQLTPPKSTGFNPVGFSFGATVSPPVSTTKDESPKPVAAVSVASNDSLPASKASDGVTTESGGSTESGSFADSATDKNEEAEDTLLETSGRVYGFIDKRQEDGSMKKQWVGFAMSTIKINKHRETSKTRILARSQTNTKILVNFNIHKELKPTVNKTAITFVGFEGSKPQSYMIRLGTEQMAKELNNKISEVVEGL
ncbi:uncharacterized protein MELLADRAFT_118068 [Melampsora larici-populina 98AG31]|uniref:RanBD1 domain-containing protein n=1 Tax=Melampsora larici-populina (strain 98AG31 / pathotype 3-4-7) TaxID=747676 RepID=F4S4T7_MELLP|nr:uncharacterized protein MELLADRAFT_118068 [Melampsora larici-populina 98AG31]EGG00345.1 hypothetical protein MELLADRAFT_118068 [Melampsora larici-populina 98AG31]